MKQITIDFKLYQQELIQAQTEGRDQGKFETLNVLKEHITTAKGKVLTVSPQIEADFGVVFKAMGITTELYKEPVKEEVKEESKEEVKS